MALGVGPGAEIQAALAHVVIGGLVASTLVTLVLIPVTYITTAGVAARVGARRRWPGFRGRRPEDGELSPTT